VAHQCPPPLRIMGACPTCGHLFLQCPACQGRKGGRARTTRKRRAARQSLVRAREVRAARWRAKQADLDLFLRASTLRTPSS